MGRLYVCKGYCGEKYELEKLSKIGNNNYCENCYKKITEDKKYRQLLHKEIKDVFKISTITGRMLREIKTYEDNSYKLKGMWMTIQYCKNVKKMNFDIKYSLACIGWHYEDAKKYYIEQSKKIKTINETGCKILKDRIVITEIDNVYDYKKSKLINLEDLLNE